MGTHHIRRSGKVLALVPRMQAIHKACGVYYYTPSVEPGSPLDKYLKFYSRTDDAKHGLSFTRWVSRNHEILKLTTAEANELSAAYSASLDEGRFFVSDRYNDILRCSMSSHFSTCFAQHGLWEKVPKYLLKDPSLFLVHSTDRAGHFIWRRFARLVRFEDSQAVLLMPVYGNLHELHSMAILKKLHHLFHMPMLTPTMRGVEKAYLLPSIKPPPYDDAKWLPESNEFFCNVSVVIK